MPTEHKNSSPARLSRRGFLGTVAAWAAAALLPLPAKTPALFVAPVAPRIEFYAYETIGAAIIDRRALDLIMKMDFQ